MNRFWEELRNREYGEGRFQRIRERSDESQAMEGRCETNEKLWQQHISTRLSTERA